MSQKYEYDEKTNTYTPVDENSPININKDTEKVIAIVLWAIQFVTALFWPVIAAFAVYVIFKGKSKFLTDTSKEVLNYGISYIIYFYLGIGLSFILIGIPILVAAVIYGLIIPIFGILQAGDNKIYKVPFAIRFIQ
ncbi:MAG: hypothetical protein K0Q49_267 [Haloplasmataceae bacterium]|jgi:uncharacterized Tic20 family protein|nr:hypothetical protein [Haloplasmataceae bacterium]